MANLNKVILIGRLTADPELKQTNGGVCVTSFSVAIDRRGKSGEDKLSDFISCVAWRATAEFITRYFKRGNNIGLCGSIQVRSYSDRNGDKRYVTEVVCDEAFFIDNKSADTQSAPQSHQAPHATASGGETYIPEAYTQLQTPIVPKFEDIPGDDNLPF